MGFRLKRYGVSSSPTNKNNARIRKKKLKYLKSLAKILSKPISQPLIGKGVVEGIFEIVEIVDLGGGNE